MTSRTTTKAQNTGKLRPTRDQWKVMWRMQRSPLCMMFRGKYASVVYYPCDPDAIPSGFGRFDEVSAITVASMMQRGIIKEVAVSGQYVLSGWGHELLRNREVKYGKR